MRIDIEIEIVIETEKEIGNGSEIATDGKMKGTEIETVKGIEKERELSLHIAALATRLVSFSIFIMFYFTFIYFYCLLIPPFFFVQYEYVYLI